MGLPFYGRVLKSVLISGDRAHKKQELVSMSKTRLLLLEASAFIRISRIFTSESVFLLKVHTRSSRTCKVTKGYSRKKKLLSIYTQ